ILDEAQRFAGLHPIHRSDETRERGPRIRMDALLAAQAFEVFGVDDTEFQAKLLLHFQLPLELQRRRTNDEDGACAVTNEQFLDDEPGLDGFAEADIIGDEKIDTRHVNRANNGIKLIALDGSAAAKRRLEEAAVGVRSRTPTDRIKER